MYTVWNVLLALSLTWLEPPFTALLLPEGWTAGPLPDDWGAGPERTAPRLPSALPTEVMKEETE
jgi:hypothetical protein